MDFEWMAWTLPTAAFFICIALGLAAMTIWEIRQPTVERRGFLGITTTRGDRFFIGLVTGAYIHLAWIGLTDASLWWALALMLAWMGVLLHWG